MKCIVILKKSIYFFHLSTFRLCLCPHYPHRKNIVTHSSCTKERNICSTYKEVKIFDLSDR